MAGLSPKQLTFVAAYIGKANKNATEAARIAGYTHADVQGPRLLGNVRVRESINEHLAQIKREGIANQQNRIDALNDRHNLMNQVIAERAADAWTADVPGGSTGLVVKQLKHVTHEYEKDPDNPNSKAFRVSHEQWESTVDTGLLRELREHEKQVAQEVGDWKEKSEITGKDGEPVEFLYREHRSADRP